MTSEEALRALSLALYNGDSIASDTLGKYLDAIISGGDIEKRVAALEASHGKELTAVRLEAVAEVLTEAIKTYAAVKVDPAAGTVSVTIEQSQKETVINTIKMQVATAILAKLGELKDAAGGMKKIAVKDHTETELDLTGESIDVTKLIAFVKQGLSGVTGDKTLNDMNGKSFTVVVTAADDSTYEYGVTFTVPA